VKIKLFSVTKKHAMTAELRKDPIYFLHLDIRRYWDLFSRWQPRERRDLSVQWMGEWPFLRCSLEMVVKKNLALPATEILWPKPSNVTALT